MPRILVRRLGSKPVEEIAQRRQLLLAEPLAEQRADARDVVIRRLLQLLSTRVGQLRVDDTRVAVTCGLLDEPAPLQPVEEACDSGRREQYLLGKIDASQHP